MNMSFRKLAIPVILFSMMAVGPSFAATITVKADAADVLGGNGVCSLREAIQNINDGALTYADCPNTGDVYGASDTINVPAGTYTNALVGAAENSNVTGDLDILVSVTITGAGAGSTSINGGGIDRVLDFDPPVAGGVVVTISGVTIEGGSSPGDGGGFYNTAALTITDSIISGNTAVDWGGGILHQSGSLTITNSTINGNTATNEDGGGIYNGSNATATITNSTISGNNANWGGGIYNDGGTFTTTNTTISGNTAAVNGGGIYNDGTMNFTNTIIANSGGGDDCINNDTIATNKNNLIEDVTNTCGVTLNVDPNLGGLANNGGNTNTHALLAGSIAIDAGTCVVATDQRGSFRDCSCDIGAYEYNPPANAPSCGSGPGSHTLMVFKIGAPPAGMGYVYSVPSGISCPSTCTATFADGTQVTLYTKNRNGMEFFRWEGACAGVWRGSPCVLTIDDYKEVPVRFYPQESVVVNQPPVYNGEGTWLVSPLNGSAGVPTTYLFIWSNLTDPDGNPITYELLFCDGFESGNCSAWSSVVPRFAGQKPQTIFAGLGAMGGGVVIIGFLLGGGMRTRRGRAFLLALFMVTSGFTAAACSSSDSDSSNAGASVKDITPTEDEPVALTCASVEDGQQCQEVAGLEPYTTYYWKVVTSDGNGGTLESDIWSFTTGE